MKKHRVTLTDDELRALMGRLVPITPNDYDLETYATLRGLYGRFEGILLKSQIDHQYPAFTSSPATARK